MRRKFDKITFCVARKYYAKISDNHLSKSCDLKMH